MECFAMKKRLCILFLTVAAVTVFGLIACSAPAYAYVGPGLGIAFVWMLFGPAAAIATTVAMVAYFPLRYVYKKHKSKKKKLAEAQGEVLAEAAESDTKAVLTEDDTHAG